jgi:hypothetical protein
MDGSCWQTSSFANSDPLKPRYFPPPHTTMTTPKPKKAKKHKSIHEQEQDAKIKQLLAICGSPVYIDSRTCFGIYYYDTLEKALAYSEYVQIKGYTYNGGFFHGMPCGRDDSYDFVVSKEHCDPTDCPAYRLNHLIDPKHIGKTFYAVTE